LPGISRPPPLALYLHLPWCIRKCPYCDFNSHAATEFPEDEYLCTLLADLDAEAERVQGRAVESVFIGGGTPSLFSPDAVASLLEGVSARLALTPGCEVSLEANPGAADSDRFSGYRQAGVNRLSIGVQSFSDTALAAIGRVHDARTAHAAVDAARAAGFDNLNIDIMYGLPQQTRRSALADVEQAIGHGPSHISHYELTIEPNTLFHRFTPKLPADDDVWWIHEQAGERLTAAGYGRYEVSAFARPGMACRHNLNYWRYGDYLGVGAGAHGKLSDPGGDTIERRIKHRHPRRYMAGLADGDFVLACHGVAREQRPLEFMLNAARLLDGFPVTLFEARTGLEAAAMEPTLVDAEDRGLLVREAGTIRPTTRGMRFLNELLLLFMADDGRPDMPETSGKRAPVDRGGGLPVL
jgi:oxygen-independent coproporphyrinogen-3 oxidase